MDGPNCVYTSKMLFSPGLYKFLWHWASYNLSVRKSSAPANIQTLSVLTKQNIEALREIGKITSLDLGLTEL